jgi:hypothetical protein
MIIPDRRDLQGAGSLGGEDEAEHGEHDGHDEVVVAQQPLPPPLQGYRAEREADCDRQQLGEGRSVNELSSGPVRAAGQVYQWRDCQAASWPAMSRSRLPSVSQYS